MRKLAEIVLAYFGKCQVGHYAGGRKLFLMNCAHCHADDATGDEGPNLHGLHKTDERPRSLIKNGIKGEMPRLQRKARRSGDLDVLMAFLNSLR